MTLTETCITISQHDNREREARAAAGGGGGVDGGNQQLCKLMSSAFAGLSGMGQFILSEASLCNALSSLKDKLKWTAWTGHPRFTQVSCLKSDVGPSFV